MGSNVSFCQDIHYAWPKLNFTRSGHDRFILMDVPEAIFTHFNKDIRHNLRNNPFLRLPVDTISNQCILVFKYLEEDLLSLVRKQIPTSVTKKILKDSFKGLVEMHEQDIVHLGTTAVSDPTTPELIRTRHRSRQHHGRLPLRTRSNDTRQSPAY
jgi:serine/threonine protein kinase